MIRHIGLDRDGLSTEALHLLHGREGELLPAVVLHRHIGPFFREFKDRRQTDAPASPRYDRDEPAEAPHTLGTLASRNKPSRSGTR